MNIAKYINHTNLKPTATSADILKLHNEALTYNFRAICINPCWLNLIRNMTDIKIISVVGFPFGANCSAIKTHEAANLVDKGVNEIDVVWNLGHFKDHKYLMVLKEIQHIVELVHPILVKVTIGTCYLTNSELVKAYKIVKDSGAYCIKTSTGFESRGVTLRDIVTWKELGGLKIEAAGKIKMYSSASAFVDYGADFLGTSYGTIIMKENK